MAIRAQQIRQDEGIRGVSLAAGGGVARPGRLEGVGVNGHELKPGVDERVDEQARGPLEGDAEPAAVAEAAQPADELGEARGGVGYGALPADPAGVIEDAEGVSRTRPVDADEESHCVVSRDGETLRGERSGRSLTDWRSGLPGHVAHHPVAGLWPLVLSGGAGLTSAVARRANVALPEFQSSRLTVLPSPDPSRRLSVSRKGRPVSGLCLLWTGQHRPDHRQVAVQQRPFRLGRDLPQLTGVGADEDAARDRRGKPETDRMFAADGE